MSTHVADVEEDHAQGTRVDAGDGGGYSIRRKERGITYGSADAIRYAFHVPWLGYGAVFLERPIVRRYGLYVPFALLAIWALSVIWLRPMARPGDEAAPARPAREPERPAADERGEQPRREIDGHRHAA